MSDDCITTTKEMFQEPRKKIWLRSRKRPKSDAMSISSMDISMDSYMGNKKKRPRITEFASQIFHSSTAVSKVNNTMHNSFTIPPNSSDLSINEDEADTGVYKKLKNTTPSCNNLTVRSWWLEVAHTEGKEWLNNVRSCNEVKRQEAIYELYCGENVLLNDLYMLRDYYYEPMLSSGICTSEELSTLFGDITTLIQIHSNLRDELLKVRNKRGFTKAVGPTMLKWLSTLKEPYLQRCRTLVWARHLLDEKRFSSKRFQSFLKKRLESPRSIDFWTYLDVPRNRIVKYPLLVKEILKHTPATDADHSLLKEAGDVLSDFLRDIDRTMGDAECKLAQSQINAKIEYDPGLCIANATELITKGTLKNARGIKYYCFLFDTCFAVTRATRRLSKKYNLFLPAIPRDQIDSQTEDKNTAEIGFKIGEHFFITEDEYKKRHWVDSFNKMRRRKTSDNVLDMHDKENLSSVELPQSNYVTRESISSSSINDNYLSSFIKKNRLKQKRNSIACIF